MESQEPVVRPVESVAPSISPPSPQLPKSPKSSNTLTVISFALFILLSLGVIAFLYYQNQQLKSMLASYQTTTTSPTPIASQTPNVDMTNWKTYTKKDNNFEVRYPQNFVLHEASSEAGGTYFSDGITSFGFGHLGKINLNEKLSDFLKRTGFETAINSKIEETDFLFKNIEGLKLVYQNGNENGIIKQWVDYVFTKDNEVYTSWFASSTVSSTEMIKLGDQILSTFKFLEATPSSSPLAAPS